ncbi:MAG: helix-turn-helix domain-containing protein [Acidimicrobiaceae bacterium]|nr:helix-turn-helix domain-containing protein [Acidimicrobiaceae bacterium]MBO0748136.1 helix-turn-helix domain-containing protein [Acidimicrobiaceae bacterium]
MRPNLQQEAKALGDPTRHRIFRYVAESAVPVRVAELTAHMGLNHNAIRQHLAILVDAGLVLEELEPETGRPGRRALQYRLHPEAAGAWDTEGPYELLAALLAEAVERQASPRQVGQEAGRRSAVAARNGSDVVGALEAEMERRGFRPTRTGKGTRVDFVLGRCPFEDVAATNAKTVCQLHLGLAEGLAEGLGGVEVVRLVAKNPHRAGCHVVLRRQDELAGKS